MMRTVATFARALVGGLDSVNHGYLQRLGLSAPQNSREALTARLVNLALNETATSRTIAQDP